IYQLAKLFIYPSIFEGFGIPIIEAISSGVPVITFRDGCFSEAGGPSSRYVDPGNPEEMAAAMEEILTEPERAARMIADSLVHAKQFTGLETSTHLMRLYQNLAG
ncbi:MAG: glycosyltransferase, partial [SAR324 cluster bacterium]|nr:glycosyltransferase [SAR324 cluster bacterium]